MVVELLLGVPCSREDGQTTATHRADGADGCNAKQQEGEVSTDR